MVQLENNQSFEHTVEQIIQYQKNVSDRDYLTRKLLSHFQNSPMAIPNTGLVLLHSQSSKVTTNSFTMFGQSIIENHLYTEIYKTGNQSIIYQMLNTIFNEKIKKLEN
ncbi:putative transcriptional regulator MtlR [Streptococcus pneumoniae]|nr:putative transcriptional regulator MtlR [Streptococcus pneumoniae]